MNDPNRLMKWLSIIAMVVLSLVILYPPSEKLKGGIDLVGGTSLLLEIDTTGLDSRQQRGLSARVMRILKDRVDPKGQLNLEWRPVGNTRLEVRMPRPPKQTLVRRQTYEAALNRLKAKNLTRFEVESALHDTGTQQDRLKEKLGRGVPRREPLIVRLAEAFERQQTAQESEDPSEAESAAARYEEAMSALLNTSMPITRLSDVLTLPPGDTRDKEFDKLRAEFPSYDAAGQPETGGKLVTTAIEAYDAWAKHKADLEDPSDLKRRLRGAGVLEFRILADRDPQSPTNTRDQNPSLVHPIARYTEQLAKYGPRPRGAERYQWLLVEDVVSFMPLDDIKDFAAQKLKPNRPIVEEYAGRYYVLVHNDPEYGLLQGTGRRSWKLTEAYPDRDPMSGRNVVSFQLSPRGGQFFGELTGNNIERSLCIVLDKVAMSHAVIRSRITTHGQISGDFTVEKVQNLVRTLEAGSLPARLKETPLMENTIGPSLGETNRTMGMRAAVWGAIAVAVFMLLYYGIAAGGMADLALALNLLFVLSIMAFLQATFTLPGIAGLILTVGMAVDANVLIFERIREERDRGIVFRKALNAGYDKAFSTIMDANLTTLITCVILGFVGSDEVKGFAITLGIGICTSMFTALFVTRLIFNSLISWGRLKDLSMRRIIGCPSVDWLAMRRTLWPASVLAVTAGMVLFVGFSTARTEDLYDIEFLGGTSLQIDLKPDRKMTDEDMASAITDSGGDAPSAVNWLNQAADELLAANARGGEVPGQFVLESSTLSAEQVQALMRSMMENKVQRDGMRTVGHTVEFDGKDARMTLEDFKAEMVAAAQHSREAAGHLRSARVQSVGESQASEEVGQSYEIVTIETDRALVQAAILATLGDKLLVQRAISCTTVNDEESTQEPYFVVESEDHYLSDVIGGEANFDVRAFRGGVAVEVVLDESEDGLTVSGLQKRLREVGLQPEFEQYSTRESTILPLGASTSRPGGEPLYKRFAVLATDEATLYDDDPSQWAESLAKPQLAQVEAALRQEKSLSKVIQFAPQIAGQARNRAIFAVVLALVAIVSYLWLRFGTKEYGLAAIVALVHDVAITLGMVGLCLILHGTIVGRALLLDAFRIDLPMVAAIMTVIGYSLNDTIVVFDRIRENKGRIESLGPKIINQSINQTLSRTLLTSLTTLLVVAILFVFGGRGVHGFSFALLIGVLVGTYSSVGIASPLLYRPRLLHGVVTVILALSAIGIVFAITDQEDQLARLILTGVSVVGCGFVLLRQKRDAAYIGARRAVGA